MRKKKSGDEGGGPNWMDTYGDMVTLLLTFFILLFSISSVNADKWEIIIKSFAGVGTTTTSQLVINADSTNEAGDGQAENFNGSGEEDNVPPETPEDVQNFEDLYLYLKSYIEQNGLESDVQLNKGDGYTFVTFRNNIFFDGDSASLKSDGKKILEVLSKAFTNIGDQVQAVRFDGHTARKGIEYNRSDANFDFTLSADRANNVLLYVADHSNLEPAKLTSVAHGEYQPVVPHDGTEESRVKNRRVEIYISETGSNVLSLDEIYDQIYNSEASAQ